jgi:hypothetical protein
MNPGHFWRNGLSLSAELPAAECSSGSSWHCFRAVRPSVGANSCVNGEGTKYNGMMRKWLATLGRQNRQTWHLVTEIWKLQDRMVKHELLLFEYSQTVGRTTQANMQLCRAQYVVSCLRSVHDALRSRDGIVRFLFHTIKSIMLSSSIIWYTWSFCTCLYFLLQVCDCWCIYKNIWTIILKLYNEQCNAQSAGYGVSAWARMARALTPYPAD